MYNRWKTHTIVLLQFIKKIRFFYLKFKNRRYFNFDQFQTWKCWFHGFDWILRRWIGSPVSGGNRRTMKPNLAPSYQRPMWVSLYPLNVKTAEPIRPTFCGKTNVWLFFNFGIPSLLPEKSAKILTFIFLGRKG